MTVLNVYDASNTFFSVIAGIAALFLLYGFQQLYKGFKEKNTHRIRQAKFILLFTIITLICVAVVGFLSNGKMPY